MDLPVLLLKFRDYLFWLGPIYLLAIALDAATVVCVRRLLHLPLPTERETTASRRASAKLGISTALDSDAIILRIAWHMAGRPSGAWRVSTRLYIWAASVSRSACWTVLLLTSLLSWPLSVMRVGFAVVLASLLALLAPCLIERGGGGAGSTGSTGSTGSRGRVGVMIVPVAPEGEEDVPRPGVLREWWQSAQARLEATLDVLLIGAGTGAAFIAISPNLTALLRAGLVTPLSQVTGAAIGLLVPFLPGTDLPLLVAMQSRGIEVGALSALFLVVTVSNWHLVRDLYYQLSIRAAIVFMALAGLISLVLSLLAGPLFRFIGGL